MTVDRGAKAVDRGLVVTGGRGVALARPGPKVVAGENPTTRVAAVEACADRRVKSAARAPRPFSLQP